MPLLVFNITAAPITLAVVTPSKVIPASAAAPGRGKAVNVTSEMKPDKTVDPANGKTGGLTGANFTTIAAQVGLTWEWTSDPEYLTTGLTVSGPSAGTHAGSHISTGGDPIAGAVAAGASGLMTGADKTKLDGIQAGATVTASNPPQAHTSSHVTGSDQLADAIAGGAHGLLLGADKTKLDNLTTANIPTTNEKAALVGTSGTPPSGANLLVDNADPRLAGLLVAGAPKLDLLDGTVAAAGGDIVLVGRDLLQGQTFDTLTLTETAASLALHALKPGDSLITVEMTVGAGGLVVTFNSGTGALVIELAAAGSTDDAVATAVNADASQCNGYVRAVSAAGGSFTGAQAQAPMTGGVGTYASNKVLVGGLEALPANETGATSTAKWSATSITCTSQAVGAASDTAAIVVQSNALWSQSLSAALV